MKAVAAASSTACSAVRSSSRWARTADSACALPASIWPPA